MVIAAIGPVAATFWWIGIAIFVLVVIPVVGLVAWRLIQVVAEIRRYADDIREHGSGLAGELESVAALDRTKELTGTLREGLGRYAEAVGTIAGRGAR
ncbi:MAG: hypothetical protein R3320_00745 [Nitriliruptorales bacterium]|nr:hypothetical protein [Nitriliruptorales bacterium]